MNKLTNYCSLRLVSLFLAILLVAIATTVVSTVSHPPVLALAAFPALQVRDDVAPDQPYGAPHDTQADPSGRTNTIVVDPTNPNVLYAASEFAGVWKSVDAAHSWQWASQGLLNGRSIVNNTGLAVDETNSRRLVYASSDDDLRPDKRYGGLYVSFDGASNWSHVDLPGCSRQGVSNVVFSAGWAYATTACGIATSADLLNWSLLRVDGNINPNRVTAYQQTLYACEVSQIYRSPSRGAAGTWVTGPSVNGDCFGMVVQPDDPNSVLVIYYSDTAGVDVARVDFAHNTTSSLFLNYKGSRCCGIINLAAARRPGTSAGNGPGSSYDIFASVGFNFYQFTIFGWVQLNGMHVDTWSFALPPDYNPNSGNCRAYAATDGSVFANDDQGTSLCFVFNGKWVRASSGMHTLASYVMNGISAVPCAFPGQTACNGLGINPALYLPMGDNGTWATLNGGFPGSSWNYMGCCGDSGNVFIDPALPTQVMTIRNGCYDVFRSAGSTPPSGSGEDTGNKAPTGASGGLTQIKTLPGESAAPNGDYLAVAGDSLILRNTVSSSSKTQPCTGNNINQSDWVNIAPNAPFPGGKIFDLAASGGHSTPTIYVLTAVDGTGGGQVWKGKVDSTGKVPSWQNMSAGLTQARALFANPYNPNQLYVSDQNDIKSSPDGGQSWNPESLLTKVATHNGEFRFGCDDSTYACPLSHMVFVANHPEIRVASLFPGGVAFSRDSGQHWIPLVGITTSIDRPFSSFYDIPGDTRYPPSLYVALHGRSLIRVDGNFPGLAAANFALNRLPTGHRVVVVNESTGLVTNLVQESDGAYRGVENFNSSNYSSLSYHYEVQDLGLRSPTFSHTLSTAEKNSGVVDLNDSLVARTDSLSRPGVIYVNAPQNLVSRYTDSFGSGAVRSPYLDFADPNFAQSYARISYNTTTDQVCLLGGNLRLPSCVAHSVGGTLSNTYMVVDVAGTTRTPSGNTLSVNWAFRMTEEAAPFNYRVTAGASDQAGVDWQELVVKSLGVTHQPVAGVLIPANGYTQPFADTGFTATFSDPDGASNLKVVYLQLQGAVSVSYDREHNLFFVSDQPLGTSGCAPQSAGIKITTPSLSLDCGLSAVSQPDANTLNITWHLSFTNSLSGHNYLTTLEAIDRNGGDSGVVQAGSFAVDYPPTFANLSPGSGSQNPGVAQTFSASYSDFDGRSNLDRTQLRLDAGLVFAFIGGRFVTVQQSVELYYFQNTNTLTIGNRNSTSLPSSCQIGAATTISTELAVLSCASSRVSTLYDKTLHPIGVQVTWAITPTNAMSGYTYNTLLAASDNAGVASGPTRLGSWTVNQPPNGGTNSPLQGNSQVGEVTHITTTCSDPDGWHNLHTLDFKISKGQGQGVGEPVVLWVQFDENRNLIRFYDPDSGSWSEGSPGQNLVLSSRYASLRLAGTTIQGSGPVAPTVTISWEIVFQPEAVGQYSQYLRTEDDTGSTGGWHKAGKWVVQVQK